MDAKRVVLEQTFVSAYNIENFTKFIKEFFNNCTIVNKEYNDAWNWSEFNYYIKGYTHIANYIDSNKSKIAIFAVELNKKRSVERARSMQRNFISKLISNANYDAAIVAFYSADEPKWRLSLVRLDYEFAKGRVKAKLTPAKRYSYLVGEKEPCHTAMERLLPIFENDRFNPTLDNIEEAFNVEKITEDFFKKYKEKYHELKDHLDDSEDFNEEAEKHNFTSEQFAKKLMGQLAFLYFLQKKGWLGVKVVPHTINEKQYKNAYYNYNKAARTIVPKVYQQISQDKFALNYELLKGLNDEEANVLAGCFNAEPWGSGTKSFIRDLFNNCLKLQEKEKKNFFDDYLEPLFYEALNHRRGDKNYYNKFNCKIPFLNGGLFEPLENYDWKNSKFEIPNDLFSNEHIKGKENADGILDVFDRYNFTMNEDEPLEREVAVDPEMLGKIFENLLDVKDRKSKGAFYTPREIVHYMCQESLINYLVNETDISYEDVKEFITYGEIMKDEDTSKVAKLGIEEMQIPMSVYKNLKVIDDKLADVKVADPAVGSGAFPMGMISEIVKARNNITAYMASQYAVNNKMTEAEKKMQYTQRAIVYDNRNPYILKWKTIKNSIYAVDIEASAVDITKLRLWLSLVVDEELEPTFEEMTFGENKQKDPHPLPNLDCNIMCGNSLIDEFEGIKLFDDSILDKKEHSEEEKESSWQMSLFNDNTKKLLQELFKQQDNLFGEDDIERKTIIKKKIDKTIDDIIRAKLSRDRNVDGLEKYEESLKQKTKPYFLWKLEFAKVFKEKDGFDIVIGNPPYVQIKQISWEDRKLFESKYKSAVGRFNLFYFFIERASYLVRSKGITSFIVPDRLLLNTQCAELRQWLLNKQNILDIISFDESVFNDAVVDSIIISYSNSESTKNEIKTKDRILLKDLVERNYVNIPITYFENSINNQFALNYDNAKIKLLEKIKNKSVMLGEIAEVKDGIIQGKVEDLLFINQEVDECSKRLLFGRDIIKYKIIFNDNWVNYKPEEMMKIEVERRGVGVRHGLWMRNPTIFERNKILTRQTADEIIAAYDTEQYYYANTLHGTTITDDNYLPEYVLAVLNSHLITWYYRTTTAEEGKVFAQIKIALLRQLPILKADKYMQSQVADLVTQIHMMKNKVEYEAEMESKIVEIDDLLYKAYGFTEKEIEIMNSKEK